MFDWYDQIKMYYDLGIYGADQVQVFVDGAPTAVMVFVHGNGQISTSATTSTGSAALSFIITYAGQ